MTIPRSGVTAAVLAAARATGLDVGDNRAPRGDDGKRLTSKYVVLEHPGGPLNDDGTVEDPEAHLLYRFRIRCVGGDDSAPASGDGARLQAEALADRVRGRLMDRSIAIAGDGFVVAARVNDGYTVLDVAGTALVNTVDDYLFTAVPAPT